MKTVTTIAAIALAHMAGAQTIIHVDADSRPGGDGLSWPTAFQDLQDALSLAAGINGEVQIWIADGVYKPDGGTDNRSLSFFLHDDVGLYGGFAGGELSLDERDIKANVAILSGAVGDKTPDDNSFHVVTAQAVDGAILDGLTIADGNALDPGNCNGDVCDGGGLRTVAATMSVRQSRFQGCIASRGGAFGLTNGSTVAFELCEFVGNTATFVGGAGNGSGGSFVDCLFEGNSAATIGGACTVAQDDQDLTFTGCDFIGNTSGGWAGAVSVAFDHAVFTDCHFEQNIAQQHGGAVDIGNDLSSVTMIGCTLIDNASLTERGGAVFGDDVGAVTIVDCHLEGNSSDMRGGGVYVRNSLPLTVTGSSFTANSSGSEGGAIHAAETDVLISECTFDANHADLRGGGVNTGDETTGSILSCSFEGNTASSGGGLSLNGDLNETIVRNCEFITNEADSGGGGVEASFDSVAAIVQCTFMDNVAVNGGGLNINNGALPMVLLCQFITNHANRGGAIAISTVKQPDEPRGVSSCLMVGNTATDDGGAIYLSPEFQGFAVLGNLTIVANHAVDDGGGIRINGTDIELIGSILWGNTTDQVEDTLEEEQLSKTNFSEVDFQFSILEGHDELFGLGIIDEDPLFVSELGDDGLPGSGDEDLRLSSRSPAIDNASTIDLPLDVLDLDDDGDVDEFLPFDADGAPRRVDDPNTPDGGVGPAPVPDRGAFEFQPSACAADVNGDGNLDVLDFVAFQILWQAGDPAADCDANALFNILDFICFQQLFQAGCP